MPYRIRTPTTAYVAIIALLIAGPIALTAARPDLPALDQFSPADLPLAEFQLVEFLLLLSLERFPHALTN